jgi:hypothetical protein
VRAPLAQDYLVYRFQNNRPYQAFVPSPMERSPPSPPPRPLPGARAVMAISREKPCPGSGVEAGFPEDREESARENRLETGSSPGSPHALDRGGYRHGGGADGEGASPLPGLCLVFSASRLNFYRLPSACNPLPADGYPYVPPQSPRPRRGGSTWGYRGQAVSRDANPRIV